MPELPQILTRRPVCNGRLFKVEAADIRFSNGEEREYEYLRSNGPAAVIVAAITDDDEVILIQEYGIGIHGYEWGLPKGRVDQGESHIEAANRELKEEAGFGARELTLLKCMTQSPNYMQHKTQIVLAQGLYAESLEGDEPEPLAVQTFKLDDIGELVARADITEARTIAALYLARDYVRSQK
ncbi:ADP compounds hydrolase NudE [Agaribacterium sp. ZY112]|uniref:ADP compounds hydrolase NudE n=1 Tax=Agaribacterium sp. ZY112 TaxID=3233574 RepID=UPI0035242BA0